MRSDLWAISCYFNPCHYRTKRANYDRFVEGMQQQGVNLLVIELAFGDDAFDLAPADNVIQLRGGGTMWQKERLLNVALDRLPADCTKVAWLDNDLIFDDPRWFERTSDALDRYVVVQPFTSVIRLERDQTDYRSGGETIEGFAHFFTRFPRVAKAAKFLVHGHTGFAWAARRDLLDRLGFYAYGLTGSGDHLMAHGFAGGVGQSLCLEGMTGAPSAFRSHYMEWAGKAQALVADRIGYIPGTVLHLWHGDVANRRYEEMNARFTSFGFDPERHLQVNPDGLFEWTEAAPAGLRDWAEQMFWMRREDGDSAEAEKQQPA